MTRLLSEFIVSDQARYETFAATLPGLLFMVLVLFSVLVVVMGMCAHTSKNSDNRAETSTESEGSWDRSGSLEGCMTPITRKEIVKKFQWLSKTKESKRLHLLQLEEEYRKQDEVFWEDSGAVWQKAIMMGEKCEPPAFSGLILYDERGKRVPQFPVRPFKSDSLPNEDKSSGEVGL